MALGWRRFALVPLTQASGESPAPPPLARALLAARTLEEKAALPLRSQLAEAPPVEPPAGTALALAEAPPSPPPPPHSPAAPRATSKIHHIADKGR